ncbi:acid protease [Obba rivulosa]|uniref:Acid protease n=1 Tax=Obba rivulosa TaxID=1052685 RepID=A0A8E2AVZ4_9APHY|nr:acid protease [Obba rivulosa]
MASLLVSNRARDQAVRTRVNQTSHVKRQPGSVSIFDANATDFGDIYVASIGIGTPPTQYNVIVDTGSSSTWIGGNQAYVETNTSQSTEQAITVNYGSITFVGAEFVDTVMLAPGNSIFNQSIGVANFAEGLQGLDGVLGLGPTILTEGTFDSNQQETIPTVTDNAFSEGLIGAKQIGISFEPTNTQLNNTGEISFGAPDERKFTGSLAFVPITTASPATFFVGIDQTITYGSAGVPILNKTSGIVDTGSSLLFLASDAFARYAQVTNATADQVTGLLALPIDRFGNLESLFFNIGGTTYEFTADAQIWPRALNADIGGTDDNVYLIVADNGVHSGSGHDFTLGLVWLQRFYMVYDSANDTVGFATTQFTNSTINGST